MARIVPKLNLNKTPEVVDNNSLIFAKNIRFNANGLSSDFGFDKVFDRELFSNVPSGLKIVGVIPYNTCYYIFLSENTHTTSQIWKYDELANTATYCDCNWHWSGGKIDGVVNVTLNGDILLTIAEYDVTNGVKVPLKTINLGQNGSSSSDDETLYTQAPNIPLVNLTCDTYYQNVIPAGVYQFFVRYEIKKNFYTNWIPVSRELYAGTIKTKVTNQGEVKYVDTSIDSNFSFLLDVHWLNSTKNLSYKTNYTRFQLGFIISHDDEVYARAYKHYLMNTTEIQFDYDTEFIEEIDVSDLLESIYNVYNVGNVTAFKNKLYISNYLESDLNPKKEGEIESFVNNITVSLGTSYITQNDTYFNLPIVYDANRDYVLGFINNGSTKYISSIIQDCLRSNTLQPVISSTAKESSKLYFYSHPLYHISVTIQRACTDYGNVRPTYSGPYNTFIDLGLTEIENQTTTDGLISAICGQVNKVGAKNGKFYKSDGTPESGLYYSFEKYLDVTNNDDYDTNLARITLYIRFDISLSALEKSNTISNNNITTLIPYQKYNFYVHLVRHTGEITNGYKVATITVPEYSRTGKELPCIIYPIFAFKRNIPSGYAACFMSVAHIGNNVSQVFNIHNLYSSEVNPNYKELVGDCLELDTRLRTDLVGIRIVFSGYDTTAHYRASYDSEDLLTFGASGKLVIDEPNLKLSNDSANNRFGFIISPYEAHEDYVQPVKCTGYLYYYGYATEGYPIYTTSLTEYKDFNLLGHLCWVIKLNDNHKAYFSGSDIYIKYNFYNYEDFRITTELIPLEESISTTNKVLDWDERYYDNPPRVDYANYFHGHEVIVYSNFNLNFLSLTKDFTPRFITKTIDNGDVVKSSDNATNVNLSDEPDGTKRQTFIVISTDSSLLSEIYELRSMYHSYTRKLFQQYTTDNTLIRFENTIRSSQLEGDEAKVYIYKFKPTDYYNVPTDKGIIINLVAVGDNILVHTQDSIYKFSGSNTLTAQGGEDVQMKETEVFDTGIQELFGSEFGYAGLASKEHQILSEFGYTFWDKDSGRIYLYTGNAQMKVLSDDISKLLRRTGINNIHLADDYYNNRIFICVEFSDSKTATLSYDFVAKSFISLHDFKFNWHFKTKTKCYFVYNEISIYKVGIEPGSYKELNFNDTLYPIHFSNSNPVSNCIVDVIFNDRFEVIKTLNTIQWICNEILSFDATVNMAEETFRNNNTNPEERYKGDILRIYTDSCMTDNISLIGRSNDSINDYKKIRYNLGKWTFNYFRNILHRSNDQIGTRPFRQDDTLLYGKYIVARFIFNRTTDFKFEDVTFITSNDYNV